jgi:hypothetical protein
MCQHEVGTLPRNCMQTYLNGTEEEEEEKVLKYLVGRFRQLRKRAYCSTQIGFALFVKPGIREFSKVF